MGSNEAFSRTRIDDQLRDAGWSPTDGRSVRFEYPLPDRTRADYVLCDARGQALAVIEAKRASRALGEAEPQALAYAAALQVPFVLLANGDEGRFRDLDRDAHFRPVATIFGQDELERRLATRTLRVPPTEGAIDARVARPPPPPGAPGPRWVSPPASPAAPTSGTASTSCAARSSWAGASCWSRWRPA